MGMNIVGNVNGSYKAPKIDLFEIAEQRGVDQQPVKAVSSIFGKDTAIKVNISKEGLQAFHGSKLQGSYDLNSQKEQIEYMSEHQPVVSFTNRLGIALQDSYAGVAYENRPSVEDQGNTVLNTFKKIADEIASGYADGSRVRFVEDSSGEDGYRRLTMEDELAILQEEFDEFVESRFGKKYQEWNIKQINAINDIQKTKQRLGIGDGKMYEPEKVPERFAENLIKAGRTYIVGILK